MVGLAAIPDPFEDLADLAIRSIGTCVWMIYLPDIG